MIHPDVSWTHGASSCSQYVSVLKSNRTDDVQQQLYQSTARTASWTFALQLDRRRERRTRDIGGSNGPSFWKGSMGTAKSFGAQRLDLVEVLCLTSMQHSRRSTEASSGKLWNIPSPLVLHNPQVALN